MGPQLTCPLHYSKVRASESRRCGVRAGGQPPDVGSAVGMAECVPAAALQHQADGRADDAHGGSQPHAANGFRRRFQLTTLMIHARLGVLVADRIRTAGERPVASRCKRFGRAFVDGLAVRVFDRQWHNRQGETRRKQPALPRPKAQVRGKAGSGRWKAGRARSRQGQEPA
jgi:hypothetical protein